MVDTEESSLKKMDEMQLKEARESLLAARKISPTGSSQWKHWDEEIAKIDAYIQKVVH